MKPLEEAPGGSGVLHQIKIEVERRLPFRLVELGLQFSSNPARRRIGGGRQEGHVLAPAGLAAQADAVDLVVLVGHLAGRIGDEFPGGRVRHLEPGLLHQIGAIHDHRASP